MLENTAAEKEALLIVDVQNDFCPGGALPVPDGDAIADPVIKMVNRARKKDETVIATRDWHPAEMPEHFKIWPVHCVAETLGAEFHPKLKAALHANDLIISKGYEPNSHGYSGFEGVLGPIQLRPLIGGPGVETTELFLTFHVLLKSREVKRLLVGGLATDYCVKATVLDALREGFGVTLLIDACRGVNLDPGDSIRAIEEMKKAGAKLSYTFMFQ